MVRISEIGLGGWLEMLIIANNAECLLLYLICVCKFSAFGLIPAISDHIHIRETNDANELVMDIQLDNERNGTSTSFIPPIVKCI